MRPSPGPKVNSAELEFFPAHKYQNANNYNILGLSESENAQLFIP